MVVLESRRYAFDGARLSTMRLQEEVKGLTDQVCADELRCTARPVSAAAGATSP